MKNILPVHHPFKVMILFLAFCSCNQKTANQKIDMKGMKAPEVKNATLELKMPAPVSTGDSTSAKPNQDTTRFTYQLLLDNKTAPDKLSMSGNIEEYENGKLSVKTSQGQLLQMLFFIPGNQQLLLPKGTPVNINSNQEVSGASLKRTLHLLSNDRAIFSSATVSDNSPVSITVSKSLVIQQGPYNEKLLISDSKYASYYTVPVYIILNGNKKGIEAKNDFYFHSDDQEYKLVINQSLFSAPKKEYQPVSEGQGYFLNYLLIRTK